MHLVVSRVVRWDVVFASLLGNKIPTSAPKSRVAALEISHIGTILESFSWGLPCHTNICRCIDFSIDGVIRVGNASNGWSASFAASEAVDLHCQLQDSQVGGV